MDPFNVAYQYQLYLKRMSLSEAKMPEDQKREIKFAFYGAFGQMLILLQEDIPKLPEKEGFLKLKGMVNQIAEFFTYALKK